MFGEENARFNTKEYINWLKASYCLKLLKEGLHPFISHRMKAFHTDLLTRNTPLREPCKTSCRARGTTLTSLCWACSEWKKVILKHHRHQNNVSMNWGNCSPPHWRTDYWELSKAYMPRGNSDTRAADQCDASALLNLINFCDCFHSVDLSYVKEVIHYRNKLMHSSEYCVEDDWMTHYRNSLKSLVQQFSHVPEMTSAGHKIEKVLNANLSVCMTDGVGVQSDSPSQWEIGVDQMSQWETELLQERLQELLRAAADEDNDTKTQDTEHLKRLGSFLQANRDLADRFSTELQSIDSLQDKEDAEGRAKKRLRTK